MHLQLQFSRKLVNSLVIGIILFFMAACQPASIDDTEFVVADLFATPGKALATLVISPTPAPDETAAPGSAPTLQPTLPLPTAVVLQQPTAPLGVFQPTPTRSAAVGITPPADSGDCSIQPSDAFLPIWQNVNGVRGVIGCPTGEAFGVSGVWQSFENGAMFWRQSNADVFVISLLSVRQGAATDNWWRFNDTWQEGVDPAAEGLQPPEGLIEPVRGFGKLWRTNGFIREALGWANQGEFGTSVLWQEFEGGWMMTGPDQAPIYVMSPNDSPPYSSGTHLGPLP